MPDNKISKIRKITIFLLILALLFSGGCAGTSSKNQETDPIKVGLLVPYTGVYTSLGQNITRGIELYLDQVGWEAGGRKIKLIKEDTEMKGPVIS